MKYREDYYSVGFIEEMNRIRKAVKNCEPNLITRLRELFWIISYSLEVSVDFSRELKSQAIALILIPRYCFVHLDAGNATKNYWERHYRWEYLSKISCLIESHEKTSSGLRR